METRIGITDENLAEVAHALNTFLADEFILYVQTRKAHWNVESSDFSYLHKFFEDQYIEIDQIVDDIAERIRSLGHYASATMNEYLRLTQLTEKSSEGNDGKGHLRDLLLSHESIIINLRKNIDRFNEQLHDAGSSDFITGIMEKHEKIAWMLRSHLK
jgi:starvation-inducible DNA-binding protein